MVESCNEHAKQQKKISYITMNFNTLKQAFPA